MKTPAPLTLIALLFATISASAQNETAYHRAAYDSINKAEASLKKVKATHKDEPTEFALTGYLQGGEVKKIVTLCSDDGSGPMEYYLEDEQPLFVYSVRSKMIDDGKRGAKVEGRLYFKDGAIFKWITTETPASVFHGEDYQATTEMHTANCAAFVAASMKAASKM